jgi:hypothetical protein
VNDVNIFNNCVTVFTATVLTFIKIKNK